MCTQNEWPELAQSHYELAPRKKQRLDKLPTVLNLCDQGIDLLERMLEINPHKRIQSSEIPDHVSTLVFILTRITSLTFPRATFLISNRYRL
jgi:serine/threonine protein kinase